jgi:hypothetical protein
MSGGGCQSVALMACASCSSSYAGFNPFAIRLVSPNQASISVRILRCLIVVSASWRGVGHLRWPPPKVTARSEA